MFDSFRAAGPGSTDSVVGEAVVSRRFSAWVAGLTFAALGAVAQAAAELSAIPDSSRTFRNPVLQLIMSCKILDRLRLSRPNFLRLTCNSD